MATLDIFKETTQEQILNELRIQNGHLRIISNGWNAGSWNAIVETIDAGGGARYFPVGTRFEVPHTEYGNIKFDAVAHDHYHDPSDPNRHTMTLLMHDVIYNRMFDATQALYAVSADVWPDGLPAGTYNFTLLAGYETTFGGGETPEFQLTSAVPVGGQIMFPWAYGAQVDTTKISTYASATSTTAIESNVSVAISEGTPSGTSLGTADGSTVHMNHTHRIRFGSNNYGQSALRQWLNSDAAAGAWQTPQTEFSRPAGYANVAGFLHGIDAGFLSAVQPVDIVCAKSGVYEPDGVASGNYTLRDRFALMSQAEIFGTQSIAAYPEGSRFEYYVDSTDADRIKYDMTNQLSARLWWLRSPYPGYAYIAHCVYASGALNGNYACSGCGAAALATIYKSA